MSQKAIKVQELVDFLAAHRVHNDLPRATDLLDEEVVTILPQSMGDVSS